MDINQIIKKYDLNLLNEAFKRLDDAGALTFENINKSDITPRIIIGRYISHKSNIINYPEQFISRKDIYLAIVNKHSPYVQVYEFEDCKELIKCFLFELEQFKNKIKYSNDISLIKSYFNDIMEFILK